jgi:hypothetical protein
VVDFVNDFDSSRRWRWGVDAVVVGVEIVAAAPSGASG